MELIDQITELLPEVAIVALIAIGLLFLIIGGAYFLFRGIALLLWKKETKKQFEQFNLMQDE